MEPSVATSVGELDDALLPSRLATSPVAYVPTMGAMHAGHVELLRAARRLGDVVVASIFVNPTQFSAGEDLERYPRTLAADLELCGQENVDIVFVPSVESMYPEGFDGITIDPGPHGARLEGAIRPDHFRGVLTIVAKLFAMVRPSHALLGEKDYQQLVLVRRMVADLWMPIDVVSVPTVRDEDGLALSSRNRFLSEAERKLATTLFAALSAGRSAQSVGRRAVLNAATQVLETATDLQVDYLELTGPDLGPPPRQGEARLLVAARVGTTRLMDEVAVFLGGVETS